VSTWEQQAKAKAAAAAELRPLAPSASLGPPTSTSWLLHVPNLVNPTLVGLQLYFMLMNVTVERAYSSAPLVAGDARFLVAETIDFCQKYNPLFLARPDWMVAATRFSAYGFFPFYAMIIRAAISNRWDDVQLPIAAFVGMKAYALGFYHYMEFTSATPPAQLLPYFAVEGPYLLSLALVSWRLWSNRTPPPPHPKGFDGNCRPP
jgi:hypothetical protein